MTDPILQFFATEHLPPHLREVSGIFRMVALDLVEKLPRNPERTVALRKLLEAKDAAVRARGMTCGACRHWTNEDGNDICEHLRLCNVPHTFGCADWQAREEGR